VPNYCVNTNAQPDSRDHEVHDVSTTEGCLPDPGNRLDLGWHRTCADAVNKAQQTYSDVNGCYYCAHECHTT
jgi:hypothetical protein